jgi:hypothetical protein
MQVVDAAGDCAGVFVIGYSKRSDEPTLIAAWFGKTEIVLHSHEHAAKLFVGDLVGTD